MPRQRRGLTLVELLVVMTVLIVLLGVLLPALLESREAARHSQCRGNYKQLLLAFHNYHDVHGSLPPAQVVDVDGRAIHSWRALVLPYIDQATTYARYDFSEPWNGPNNRMLENGLRQPALVRHCPSSALPVDSPLTQRVVIVGAPTAFPGAAVTSLIDFTDGTRNTILLTEFESSKIHWMEPRDLDFDGMSFVINDRRRPSISSPHPRGAVAGFADGSVRTLSRSLPPETIRALLTISGGEPVDGEALDSQASAQHVE